MKDKERGQINYYIHYYRKETVRSILKKIGVSLLTALIVYAIMFLCNRNENVSVNFLQVFLSVAVGLIIVYIWPSKKEEFNIKSIKVYIENRRNALKNELKVKLKQVFSTVLESLRSKDDNKQKHYLFSLKEIIEANTDPLVYNPEYKLLDSVFSTEGTLSITEASPAAWLDPTYNFFLLCQYIANIKKRLDVKSQSSRRKYKLATYSRTSTVFKSFLEKSAEMINNLSEIDTYDNLKAVLKNSEVRFYFMGEESIRNNKGVVEYLVAGHELSGVFLFIVSDKIKTVIDTNAFREAFIKKEGFPLDVAFALSDNEFSYTKRTEQDTLVTSPLKDTEKQSLYEFVKNLASIISGELSAKKYEYLLYPTKEGFMSTSNINFVYNNRNCYVNVE